MYDEILETKREAPLIPFLSDVFASLSFNLLTAIQSLTFAKFKGSFSPRSKTLECTCSVSYTHLTLPTNREV